MANAILAAPNRIESANLSGGDWLAGSRANLATTPYRQAALSAGLDPAATQFGLSLDRPRSLRVLALLAHNLSSLAQVRWRIWSLGQLVHDSGWTAVWPALPMRQRSWRGNFWSGTMSEEERASYASHHIRVLPESVLATEIRCELLDQQNPAGHVRIGRAGVYDVWQAGTNFSYGDKFGHRTTEKVVTSEGGRRFSSGGQVVRTLQLAFDDLSRGEVYALLNLERQLGQTGELIFVADPDDPLTWLHEAFPASFADFGPASRPVYGRSAKSVDLQEIIA